jgi:hypothetical protein
MATAVKNPDRKIGAANLRAQSTATTMITITSIKSDDHDSTIFPFIPLIYLIICGKMFPLKLFKIKRSWK